MKPNQSANPMAPLQSFHQAFMGATPTNPVEAQNQQIMAQNHAAMQSGQFHLLQPLQVPGTPALPIYTNK